MNPPSKPTLARYGLSAAEWQAMYDAQNGTCPICLRTGIPLCIDHEHVKGWRRMPPDERKRYTRGLLCRWCNLRRLPRELDAVSAERVWRYLAAHAVRLAGKAANDG